VLKSPEHLAQIALRRIDNAGRSAREFFDRATEIVVFGSMAAGLDGPKSDIDVLCIGNRECIVKTDSLDLIIVAHDAMKSPRWLQSELATHVSQYGVWIRGSPEWLVRTQVGPQAVEEKRRRVAAFMKYLPASWLALEEGFRRKYSLKVRREAQRLLLLERGVPVPPTRLLDAHWDRFSDSPHEIYECLSSSSRDRRSPFLRDFLARVDASLQSTNAEGN